MSDPTHDPTGPAGHMWTWNQYAPPEEGSPTSQSRPLHEDDNDWDDRDEAPSYSDKNDDHDEHTNPYNPTNFDDHDGYDPRQPALSFSMPQQFTQFPHSASPTQQSAQLPHSSTNTAFNSSSNTATNSFTGGSHTVTHKVAVNGKSTTLHHSSKTCGEWTPTGNYTSSTSTSLPVHRTNSSTGVKANVQNSEFHGGSDILKPLDIGQDLFEEDDYSPDEAQFGSDGDSGDESHQNNYFMQLNAVTTHGGNTMEANMNLSAPGKPSRDQRTLRLPSYLGDLEGEPSPTESQLANDDFQFHRGVGWLTELQQMERFGRIANMSVVDNIEPDVSRRQQWYVFRRAHSIIGDQDDDYHEKPAANLTKKTGDDSNCRCHGDSARCFCSAGQCKCDGCGKATADESRGCGCPPGKCGCADRGNEGKDGKDGDEECEVRAGDDSDDSNNGSAPMDIGKTPITPTFPLSGRIPGLGGLASDSQQDDAYRDSGSTTAKEETSYPGSRPQPPVEANEIQNPGCSCICGNNYACLKGKCNCDAKQAPPAQAPENYKPDRLSIKPIGWLIKKAAEEREVDTYHPNHRNSPTRSSRLSYSGTSSPLGPPPRMTPIDGSMRRPDTPRPSDRSIRQSIKPEGPPPYWNQQSTPGYEDRSPSPSPISHPGDIHMRDATPTPGQQPLIPRQDQTTASQGIAINPVRQPQPALPQSIYPGDSQSQRTWRPLGPGGYIESPGRGQNDDCFLGSSPDSSPSLQPPRVRPNGYPKSYYPPPSAGHTTTLPPQRDDFTNRFPVPPIPSDDLQPAKTRKPNTSSRRKSVVADSGISKPVTKSRAVSRKVTAKQPKPAKEKTAAQKKKEEGKVAAAVKKIDEKEKKERAKREAREKEDAEKQQGDGTPVRRSVRIRVKIDRLSGDFGSDG